MFCINCGTQLNDDSCFCYNCGVAVQKEENTPELAPEIPAEEVMAAPDLASNPANNTSEAENSKEVFENPYAQVYSAPAQPPQPTQNLRNPYQPPYIPAPQPPVYNQSAPAENGYQPYANPTQPPQQPYNVQQPYYNPTYSNLPPQQQYQPAPYNPQMQAPMYQGYYVNPTAPVSKLNNIFSFITAGILSLLLLLFFFPWVTVYGEGVSMLAPLASSSSVVGYLTEDLILCSLLAVIAIGLLIPAIILAFVKRHNMPIGFIISTAVLSSVNIAIFAIIVGDASALYATIVPYIFFFLSIASIIFGALARKR